MDALFTGTRITVLQEQLTSFSKVEIVDSSIALDATPPCASASYLIRNSSISKALFDSVNNCRLILLNCSVTAPALFDVSFNSEITAINTSFNRLGRASELDSIVFINSSSTGTWFDYVKGDGILSQISLENASLESSIASDLYSVRLNIVNSTIRLQIAGNVEDSVVTVNSSAIDIAGGSSCLLSILDKSMLQIFDSRIQSRGALVQYVIDNSVLMLSDCWIHVLYIAHEIRDRSQIHIGGSEILGGLCLANNTVADIVSINRTVVKGLQALVCNSLVARMLRVQESTVTGLSFVSHSVEDSTVAFNDSTVAGCEQLHFFASLSNTVLFLRQSRFENITSTGNLIVSFGFNLKLEIRQVLFDSLVISNPHENGGLVGEMLGFFLVNNLALRNVRLEGDCQEACGILFGRLYASGRIFDLTVSGELQGKRNAGLIGERVTTVPIEIEHVQLFTSRCSQEELASYQRDSERGNTPKQESQDEESTDSFDYMNDLPDDYVEFEFIRLMGIGSLRGEEDQARSKKAPDLFYKELEFTIFYQMCARPPELLIRCGENCGPILGSDEYRKGIRILS